MTRDEFAEKLGFEDYASLIYNSEVVLEEGDFSWYVTKLPNGKWAAWDDAELSLERVEYYNSQEEAIASQYTTCAFCGAEIPVIIAGEVPGIDDDKRWSELANFHLDGCEWVLTRAHQINKREGINW